MARFLTVDNIPCSCGRYTENPLLKFNDNLIGEAVEKSMSGQLIQNAAPFLSSEEREVLMSGMCFECQKVFFKPPNKRGKK